MITDGRTVPDGSTIEADVCIAGAGPAGISLALEFLGRSNLRVALLETGGLDFDPDEQDVADAEVVGQPYFPVRETRIRMLGGSTISWGGIVGPLDAIDFERREWVPNSGWPFTRQELDPYYGGALQLCEVDPKVTRTTVEELGDAAGTRYPTPDTVWDPIYFSPPTRFGKLYAPKIEAADNITAYLHSTATDVKLAPEGTHVEGVEVRTPAGNRFTLTARQYVLAGGGIENARLLLTSRAVQTNGIGNQHDLVGRYFQEHPRVFNRYHLPDDSTDLASRVVGAAGTLRFSRLGLTEEVQRREGLLNFLTNLSFGYSGQETPQFEAARRIVNASRAPWSDSPYYQDEGGGPNRIRWEDVRTCLKRPDRTVRSLVGAALNPPRMRRWLQVGCSVEQVPRPENRIVLTREFDRYGVPTARLEWTLDPEEERTYRRGMELVLGALETYAPGIGRQRFADPEPWPGEVLGTWHHIGTTRMAADPRRGVVDADSKVHSVANLFIAGSSVFPASGATAPTLTIIALALRMGDHLKGLLDRK